MTGRVVWLFRLSNCCQGMVISAIFRSHLIQFSIMTGGLNALIAGG